MRWILGSVCLLAAACSGSGIGDDDGGSNDGAVPVDGSVPADGGSQSDSSKPDAGGIDSGVDATTYDAGSIDNSDGFGAVRTACINEINKLRAGGGHTAYAIWDTPAIDMCVDQQATYDQQHASFHDAWLNKVYPTCNGNAQDECAGYGTTASGIVACLDSMWAERLQPNCATCDSCNSPTLTSAVIACQSTSTCDFYGKYGKECGHYVNMSADYFSMAACGFSTVGTTKDWATQNFQ